MTKIETNASYASYANGKVAPEIQETVQEQEKPEATNPPSIDASAAAAGAEVVESDSKKLKLMSMEEEATTPATQSLRYNIIKRLVVYFIFIAIFLASIFTRDIAANSIVSETRSNTTNL